MSRRIGPLKHRVVVALLTAGVILLPSFAYGLEDSGYEILETRDDNDTVQRDVRDDDGNEFELRSDAEELSDRQLDILDVITRSVFSIDALEVESMNVLFSDERADILVVPSSLEYDGEELRSYVPSGLRFTFDQVLDYDFRVLVDDYFLRFSGQYVDEDQFLSRLAEAIADPVAFLESQRPELLAQRLDEVEELVESLSQAFDEKRAELESTEAELHETRDELAEARSEIFDLRYAVLAFENATFFGRERPIDQEVVDRIVALRQDDPDMERSEIHDQLSDEGFEASRNEVDLVLAVYFREFD